MDELQQTRRNLADMLMGGLNGEKKAIDDVNDSLIAIERFWSDWFHFYVISQIYTKMLDSRDIATLKDHLQTACESTLQTGNSERQSLNKLLTSVRIEAIRLEITKARELTYALTSAATCK
jgi:hypothetical protein